MNEWRPKHIDVFAGVGGFSVAFESEGFETVAFVENDARKCRVLRHEWPGVRIFRDAKNVKSIRRFCEAIGGIDVLTAGVPCQPASSIGQMRGASDERWLWPLGIELVRVLRPGYAVFENPASVLVLDDGRAWNGIVSGLAALGFDLWWDVFPAAAFGAGHLRERVLLVAADALRPGLERHTGHGARKGFGGGQNEKSRRPIATPDLRGRVFAGKEGEAWWHETHTGIPVLAHGLSAQLARAACECAGDAVAPQVVQPIARAIRQMIL